MGSNFTLYITRWVTFLITPLVATAAGVAAVKAKTWFGIELSPAEIVAYVLALVAPIVTWLWNRGRWEIAAHFGPKTEADIERIAEKVVEGAPQPPEGASSVREKTAHRTQHRV